jgi:uncharacterized protein (DUF433 family)
VAKTKAKPDEDRLIAAHVDARWGRAEARLKRAGVSVPAIVESLRVYDGDAAQVRDAFALTPEELEAALAYYRRHKKYVDARILLNSDAGD